MAVPEPPLASRTTPAPIIIVGVIAETEEAGWLCEIEGLAAAVEVAVAIDGGASEYQACILCIIATALLEEPTDSSG